MTTKYTNDDVGQIAHEYIRGLATRARIVVQDANRDRKGWDLFFEFPGEDSASTANFFDEASPELTCLVQVKGTTDKDKRSWPIKLDNLERFAKHPLPCFFTIVHLEASSDPDIPPEPCSIYLVHVDEPMIERIMRRLREASIESDPASVRPLHKLTMNITWSEENLLRQTPSSLAQAIRQSIGGMPEYCTRKAQAWKSIGDRWHEITIMPTPEDQDNFYEDLADFAIRVKSEMDIITARHIEYRFEIPRIMPDFENQRASMSIAATPPLETTELSVESLDGQQRVILSAKAYASHSIFPFLPKKYWRLRLVSEHVSIVLNAGRPTSKIAFHIKDGAEVDIRNAGLAAQAVRLLSNPDGAVLGFSLRGHPYRHEHRCTQNVSAEIADLSVFENLYSICTRFGTPSLKVRGMHEIQRNRNAIKDMHALLGGAELQVVYDRKFPSEGCEVVFVSDHYLLIGGKVLVVVFCVDSEVVKLEKQWTQTGPSKVVGTFVIPEKGFQAWSERQYRDFKRKTVASLEHESQKLVTCLSDWADWEDDG